ncbi:LysR family transcriptional regulator BsrA [Pseudomonas paeninsulae]|uniref:LysR family transcriptional regulator BsrA n=1 Tax=Pseudomonas paeninsulae TaxID=3110772 RepID=UPI002D77A99B|nr:LysR substrate-binding domain-containing protein [Pseudomonas sp. IT1137]
MVTNLRQIDLNLLLVFDALMQEQNLTRAAQRLHLSQSTVSNALSRLRQQLGEELFQRTARGMTPTARAQVLYVPVRQALRLLQSGLGPQERFDPQSEHSFSLSLNDYAQAALLPLLLERLAKLAPRVEIHVQPDDADTLIQRLESGTLDMAIDYLHFDAPDLNYSPLQEEQLVVIGRVGHPAFAGGLSRDDYQSARHVSVLPRAGRGSPLEIVLGSARVRRQTALHLPNYLPIPAIIGRTDLLGTVPKRLAEAFAPVYALQMAPLPFDMPPVQISLIWHRQQELDPAQRWLRQQLSDLLS